MKKKIFYSWQSDLPNNTNRTLIEIAATRAATTIRDDGSLEIEPVVVRDTQGHTGSPNIAETILSQIDRSDIFLADVSFIGKVNKRPMPNPNVLIELGYAIKKLGRDKILLVMNTAKGSPEVLPFDLRMLRVITYSADNETIADARNSLKSIFQTAFEAILSKHDFSGDETADKLISLMYEAKPGRLPEARHFSEKIFGRLESKKPEYEKISDGQFSDDILVTNLDKTKEIVDDFANIVSEAACCGDLEIYLELGRIFELIADKFYVAPTNGMVNEKETDYYKILSYELYILYVAPLVREGKYELLKRVIEKPFKITKNHNGKPDEVIFEYLAAGSRLLEIRSQRLKRISAIADWIHGRREEGTVGKTNITWQTISDTDQLLSIYCNTLSKPDQYIRYVWPPFSVIYNTYSKPGFILSARRKTEAQKLIQLFNLKTTEELQNLVREEVANQGKLFGWNYDSSIEEEDMLKFGTV